ncbi:MAG: hypothetical protein DLM60_23815 [Pseudonocardiales bacterium]|nr:MAG: hypothetical protein DLM60_23815 [Pseudonocardiales bacterium]
MLVVPTGMPINFHDALLPRDAGAHATAWAVPDRATRHGGTWHVMTAQADARGILAQRTIPMDHTDTSVFPAPSTGRFMREREHGGSVV